MTIKELDRLVTLTDLTPSAKQMLRVVRSAVITGRCGDAQRGSGTWSVAMDTQSGTAMRMSFKYKRDTNG